MRRVNDRFNPHTLPTPEQNNNRLTSLPSGPFSDLTSILNTLYLVRDVPAPLLLPSIAHLGAFHPAIRHVDGRFTPHTLPIPEQDNNQLTSIPLGPISTLTSLGLLYLVRDVPRPAFAPIFRSHRRVPTRHAPCQRPLYSPPPPIPEQGNN